MIRVRVRIKVRVRIRALVWAAANLLLIQLLLICLENQCKMALVLGYLHLCGRLIKGKCLLCSVQTGISHTHHCGPLRNEPMDERPLSLFIFVSYFQINKYIWLNNLCFSWIIAWLLLWLWVNQGCSVQVLSFVLINVRLLYNWQSGLVCCNKQGYKCGFEMSVFPECVSLVHREFDCLSSWWLR